MNITNREKQILHLIADEYSSKEIAQQLSLSAETINSHRKNMMVKMGVRNTAGLVRRGFELGCLQLSVFQP